MDAENPLPPPAGDAPAGAAHLRQQPRPAEPSEGLWQRAADYEKAPVTTALEQLVELGVELPDPRTLDEPQLIRKLDEVIGGLAAIGGYVYSTDHLSDRQLYEALVSRVLREERLAMPPGHESPWHVDLVGSGSEEDIQRWLRYYADEEDRRRWARDWPLDTIPPHEHPPHDRDRFLPRPPGRRRSQDKP